MKAFLGEKYDSINTRNWYFQQGKFIFPTGEADTIYESNSCYQLLADPGHPYRWPGSAIWMTLVSYKNYSNQSIKDSIFPPFSTYHLSSLLITVIPSSHITHILPSQFSFHTQTSMKQIVNMKRESIFKQKSKKYNRVQIAYQMYSLLKLSGNPSASHFFLVSLYPISSYNHVEEDYDKK